jgi:hypothetical protein
MSGYAEILAEDPPTKPSREDTWENPAWRAWYETHDKRGCPWDIGQQAFTHHSDDCEHPTFDSGKWEAILAEDAARRAQVAEAAPKSRRVGRIRDHETARKELEGMAQLAQDDERLSPCDAFVYGLLTSRGWRHGSVLVMGAASYLEAKSNGLYSRKQCERALDRLEVFGYIEPRKWSYVKKHDPGLYAYAKRSRRGSKGGKWPNAYLLRQDPPGNEDARPDDKNPILEMFGMAPA